MSDYLADIKKYDLKPDEAAVERLGKRLSLVMHNRDSALVAVTDPEELKRVEKNWAVDKLGVSADEAKKAVMAVAEQLKGDRTKNRVTFYYLVAKKLNKLDKV